MRSGIGEISLLIVFFIGGWLLMEWNSFFYIALGIIFFYNVLMIIYLIGKRGEIAGLDIALIIIAMVVWLAAAGAMIMEKYYNYWGILS